MKLGSARSFDSAFTRRLLVAAVCCTLVALAAALVFVLNTTGGTLFLFTTVTPALVFVSVLLVVYALVQDYRERHRLFRVEDYDVGDIIVREGDVGQCAFFIRSGEVEIVRGLDEEVVARRAPGEYFGEMSLLLDEPRNATVRASTPVRLVVLGKENFLEMIRLLPTTEQSVMDTVRKRAMEVRTD
jgi:hypothetical protein